MIIIICTPLTQVCPTRPTSPTRLTSLPVRLALPSVPQSPVWLRPPPLAQACRSCPIQNSEFKIHNFYSSCPIQNSEFKIHNFLCRLHYTYHIQTIQEERRKDEKSAKYKHLIKVPKVVCFTFQLF